MNPVSASTLREFYFTARAPREILHEGMASGFAELPVDNLWTTAVIGYTVLAIELEHVGLA